MREWIDRYASGYKQLVSIVDGITADELNFKPTPDSWSIKEIILHVADTEVVGIYRMKSVIAEDNPTLLSFDENAWTSRLHYDAVDIPLALALFNALRSAFIPALLVLEEGDWKRFGTHNVSGVLTLADLLQHFVNHVETHIRQIGRNRAAYRQTRA